DGSGVVNGSFGSRVAARGDGSSGGLEAIVRTLRQNNVLYVASAGNEGQVHFGFFPAGPDGVGFGNMHVVQWQPNNYEDGFVVPPFQTITLLIKWDSWSGQPQDFDLYIL